MARKQITEHAPRAGAAPELLMLAGRINRAAPRGETYPMFQRAAALLRHRGESVLDPSDEARAWPNAVPYARHVAHSTAMAGRADALIVLPDGLDGRLCTLLVEYATMTDKPVWLLGRRGALAPLDADAEQPLWTTRLAHRGGREDVL